LGAFFAVRSLLPRGAPAVPAPATLSVDTQPAGAELLIDGQSRGKAPLTVTMAPGTHELAVRAGGRERAVQLTLAPGAHLAQYFDLAASAPTPGRLSIVSDPPGARVSINGRPRGVSPLVVDDLAAGDYTV